MRDSTIRGLRTFCVAAKHASFKHAARELCVTPSAVSHQIKDLEELIGEPLFRRETRRIELTDLGTALAAELEPALEKLDQVVSAFIDRSRIRRVLRITLPHFFASELFVPLLGEFTEVNEGLEIRVDTSIAGSGHRSTSDASVVLLSDIPAELAAYELFPLSLVPACSRSLAQTLDPGDAATFADATLIVHETRPNAWAEWFALGGIHPRETRVVYLDSMFAVARAAERGLGVALVPVPLSHGWFESGALVRLSDRELRTPDTYYFVHRAEDDANEDICALRDWTIARFASAGAGSFASTGS